MLLTALDSLHIPTARCALAPLDSHGVDTFNAAMPVIFEISGHDTVFTRVLAHMGLDFGVAIIHTVDARPLGPWVVSSTLLGRLREQFEVRHGLGPVADRSTNTVVTRVTTANNNDMLIFSGDV